MSLESTKIICFFFCCIILLLNFFWKDRYNFKSIVDNENEDNLELSVVSREKELIILVWNCSSIFLPLIIFIFSNILDFFSYTNNVFYIMAGAVLYSFGLYILYYCYRQNNNLLLSPFINSKISTFPNIENLIFKYIRYPFFASYLLIFFGIAFFTSNLIVILLMVIGISNLIFFRIFDLEKQFLEKYGDEFKEYQNLTKLIIPYLI
jgi:protein-S-isoprenylcysteine O-methyltransferase Ste14